MKNEQKSPRTDHDARKPYQPPRLTRWGKLRDLTLGGGGIKKEPFTNVKTRF